MRSVVTLAGTLLVASAGMASADVVPPVPAIVVSGEARADIVPDTAQLSLGVQVERPAAAAAAAEVAAAGAAVMAQLRSDGIADADVGTTALTLTPISPDDQARPTAARGLHAFRASTMLLITIKPAERTGVIASHLVDKGADTIQGIEYTSSQEAGRLDELRADAMRDALHKAQVYVGALGLHLGRVLEISPVGGMTAPSAMMRTASLVAAPRPALPAEPGTLTLEADVTVRWEIVP